MSFFGVLLRTREEHVLQEVRQAGKIFSLMVLGACLRLFGGGLWGFRVLGLRALALGVE